MTEMPDRQEQPLRTRYRPAARLRHGFVTLVPWVDAVLLLLCFIWIDGRVIRRHGVRVAVPESAAVDSVEPGDVLIIGKGADGFADGHLMAFYEDEAFPLNTPEGEETLLARLANPSDAGHQRSLTILADESVSYGIVLRAAAAALRGGRTAVNLGHQVAAAQINKGNQP